MKTLYSLFLIVLSAWLVSCEEDKSVDPTLMPEATAEGLDTFGCLIDGWVYTSGRYGLPHVSDESSGSESRFVLTAPVAQFENISLTFFAPVAGQECTYSAALSSGEDLGEGRAYISRHDGFVFSGTFAGGRISEGRFDIRHGWDSAEELPVE